MIPALYPVVTLVILLLTGVQKEHRMMSLLGVLHSAAYLLITCLLILSPDEWQKASPFFLVDHLNLFLMLITGIIFTCASIYAVGYIDGLISSGELDRRSIRIFYSGFALLLLATAMALFSPNVAQFWIFAELTTVFSALLVAILAVRDTIDASLKYIFVCSTSMLFSFIGIIFLFELTRNATGTGTLDWQVILAQAGTYDAGMLGIACIFFFIGFAAKSGIVPLHTWLPEAHAKAPSAVSAVLSGAVLNIGMYGILRMAGIVHQSSIANHISLLFLLFGLITMAVASISMLRQTGTKKLIAFSSVENMGFLLLATGIGSPVALFWMLFHMMGHSLVKAGLFFSAGILHRQYHTGKPGEEDKIVDLFTLQPLAAGAFIIGCIAIIGTPLFPIFLSKFGILLEAGKVSPILTLLSLLVFAIAAVGLFRYLIPVMGTAACEGECPPHFTVPGWMQGPVILLLVLSAGTGILMIPGEEEFLMSAVRDLGFLGVII